MANNSGEVFSPQSADSRSPLSDESFDYDSVSTRSSSSSIYESDFVAATIKKREREVQPAYRKETQNNQINLHVNVINNGMQLYQITQNLKWALKNNVH